MRALIVEDSARLQKTLATALRRSNYAVDVADDGEEGLWCAENNRYDLVILDIMMPKRDGLSVLAELRRKANPVHVLLLTARDTITDRVRGLRAGADDYLVKPFALEELLARVETLCRRAYGIKQNCLTIADLEIDIVGRTVRRGVHVIELTSREYQLLEYLAHRQGHIVSRGDIEAHIYDGQVDPMSNVVDSAICNLRKKIAFPGSVPLIHTKRGQGYVFGETNAPASAA